jgi:hypothetical protein
MATTAPIAGKKGNAGSSPMSGEDRGPCSGARQVRLDGLVSSPEFRTGGSELLLLKQPDKTSEMAHGIACFNNNENFMSGYLVSSQFIKYYLIITDRRK